MNIEMMLILRDYYRMGALGRWFARRMFPVLKVIAWQPRENEDAIARFYAKLNSEAS